MYDCRVTTVAGVSKRVCDITDLDRGSKANRKFGLPNGCGADRKSVAFPNRRKKRV